MLRRRRGLGLALFALVALAVVASAVLLPARYKGTTKFLVRKARTEMVVTADRTSSVSSGDVSESEMNTEIELLNSRDLLAQVAMRTLLAKVTPPVSARDLDRAIRTLERNLDVSAVRKTNIISVAYAAQSPEVALDVLRQFSDLYLDKHLSAHRTAGAHEFFKAQSEHYKQALTQAQAQLSAFRREHVVVALDMQKEQLIRRESDLQAQVDAADAAIHDTQQRIARLHQDVGQMDATIVAQTRAVPNQYAIERLTTILVEMRNRRTLLALNFQRDDRRIVELDQQILDTEATLQSVSTEPAQEQTTTPNPLRASLLADLANADVQLAGLRARRASLTEGIAGVRDEMVDLEVSTPEHDALGRELKAAEASFQLYETKREEARIAEALDQVRITNVTVAQAPSVPALPSSPNRALVLMVGLVLACFVGLGGALGADYLSGNGTTVYPDVPSDAPDVRASQKPRPRQPPPVPADHTVLASRGSEPDAQTPWRFQ